MDNYKEVQGYFNNFWMKEDVLYLHSDEKFKECLNLGNFFKNLANITKEFAESILKAENLADKSEKNNDKNPKMKKRKREILIILLINFIIQLEVLG